MAAERTDRERFSDRAAYERWTGDYRREPADNADDDARDYFRHKTPSDARPKDTEEKP
jgi:hypothetical protein